MPSVELDSALISDFVETLDFLQHSGMTAISPWGHYTNKFWTPEVEKTITPERDSLARLVFNPAHERNLKIICGMGVYSWGFDKIIE